MTEISLTGACHCGGARFTLKAPPVELTDCDCTLCVRLGVLWTYTDNDGVALEGEMVSYVQGDRVVEMLHCPTCGCTIAWRDIINDPPMRLGLNARLLDPRVWCDVPIHRHHNRADTPWNPHV